MKQTIQVTSDGYGYHTFELKWNPTHKEFLVAKQFLKAISAENEYYPLERYGKGRWFCGALRHDGIRVYMTKTNNRNVIKLIINPRQLIEPRTTYLGIMPNGTNAFERLEHAFTDCMRRVHLPDFLEDWTLSRMDLCVNLEWNKKKGPHEIIRLLRKEPTPKGYLRNQFTSSGGSPYTETRNTHILKFSNESIALVAYDKIYQIRHENLARPEDFIPKGILRVELQYERPAILEYAKKKNVKSTSEIMQALAEDSRELICQYTRRLWGAGTHCKMQVLEKALKKKAEISKKNKERMLELADTLQTAKCGDKAFELMNLTPKQLRTCLQHFKKLGINPVPLREEDRLDRLPSLSALLEEVAEDGTKLWLTGKKAFF